MPRVARPSILAVDLGTTNLKLGLVDLEGRLLASAEQSIETLQLPDGIFEQEPDVLWRKLTRSARDVVEAAGPEAADIRAVQCSSQFFSLIPVDAHGTPTARMQL